MKNSVRARVLQMVAGVQWQWHGMNNDRKRTKRPQLINLETHSSQRRRTALTKIEK